MTTLEAQAIHWRADYARTTLQGLADPAIWGFGRVRWQRHYQAVRAQCAGASNLYNWAVYHNPLLPLAIRLENFKAAKATEQKGAQS